MISVIIPIYNQEKYIRKCISSVLNQTYGDFEINLIDDGSSDRSADICKEYLYDSRVKYFFQKNAGVSVARNLGIENSKGEWLAFIDPDDYIDETYFEKLLNNVSDDVDIVACSCKAFYKNNYNENYFFKDSFTASSDLEKKKLFLQLMDCDYGQPQKSITAIGVPWGKLYRRKFVKDNGLLFNPLLKRQQDNIFNMWAFKKARNIKYVNELIYFYRMDNINNYITSKYDKNAYNNALEFQKERSNFFEIYDFSDSEINIYYYNETFNQMIKVLNSQIMHKESKLTLSEKRRKILEIINNNYFKNAIKKLNISTINIKAYRIVYFAVKIKSPMIIFLIWWLKEMVDKLKEK